ncbi:MAG: hypothetical protein ABGX83_01905 [Nitrospira sp.]|nr:hypothetical protein [Candidatus Manganitrophaceae bacterium]HIL34471.1 hypothetical protein [Candidatus Manganitrophaceae bacterium]
MKKKSLTKIPKRKPTTKTTSKKTKTAKTKPSEKSKVKNKTAVTKKNPQVAGGKAKKEAATKKSTVKKKLTTTKGKTKAAVKKTAPKKSPKKIKTAVTKKSATAKAKPKKKKPVRTTVKKLKIKSTLHKPPIARSAPRKPKVVALSVLQPPETDKQTLPTTRIRGPIGVITHYYSHLRVAVVQLVAGSLQIGDIIQIKGHTTDLIQTIISLELDHQHVDRTVMGQLFGMKVRDHVREHDQVFKITHG